MTSATGMRAAFGGLALALAVTSSTNAAGTPVAAAAETALACGTIYEVAQGDWLHKIALKAYGEANHRAIYLANRDVLHDQSILPIGVKILIPCLDGSGPATRKEAEAAGMLDAAPAAEQEVPGKPEIGLLSGPDFQPFADPSLPKGGLIAELVSLSLARAAPEHAARISFVDDWSRHLELLDAGAFDVGFPWYKPDCTAVERLRGALRERCTGFVFSSPLYAVATGFYVRAGDPLTEATATEALRGKRICRPAGHSTLDLEEAGLMEPNVTRIIPPTTADCFAWLMRGSVDVVSVRAVAATDEIAHLGLEGRVLAIPALASARTLHVVAPESSEAGRAYIELIDEGLAELKMSGRWFEIIYRHLGTYRVSTR